MKGRWLAGVGAPPFSPFGRLCLFNVIEMDKRGGACQQLFPLPLNMYLVVSLSSSHPSWHPFRDFTQCFPFVVTRAIRMSLRGCASRGVKGGSHLLKSFCVTLSPPQEIFCLNLYYLTPSVALLSNSLDDQSNYFKSEILDKYPNGLGGFRQNVLIPQVHKKIVLFAVCRQ